MARSTMKRTDISRNDTILEIGCGNSPDPRATVTIDRVDLEAVDIVHDLDKTPWPIESESVDMLIAIHVLEHLDDLELALSEVARVLKPNAIAEFRVPVGRQMFTDPTHKHFFTWGTPAFLLQGDHERDYYFDIPLELVDRELVARFDAPILGVFSPVINWISHRWPGDWVSGTPWFSGELRFWAVKSD